MTVVNPVTVGAAAKTVKQLFDLTSAAFGKSEPRVSAADRATLEKAGWKFEKRARLGEVGIDPATGRTVTNREALRKAAAVSRILAPVPDYTPSAADKVLSGSKKAGKVTASVAGKIIRSAGGQIAVGITAAELLQQAARVLMQPKPSPPAPPVKPEGSWPAPPQAAPLPQPKPSKPVTVAPGVTKPAESKLERIRVTAKRIPTITPYVPWVGGTPAFDPADVGMAPAPSTPVGSAPSSPTLTRSQLIGLTVGGLGLLGGLLGQGGRSRRRDPITADAPIFGLTPQPGATPYVPFFGGAGTITGQCECPPKRKSSGKRKRRTVCYQGTYTEKASGLRKLKKRKIPCQ